MILSEKISHIDFLNRLDINNRFLLLYSQLSLNSHLVNSFEAERSAKPDWNCIFQLACKHRVFPIVYLNFKKRKGKYLSDADNLFYKKSFVSLSVKNIRMAMALEACLQLLEEHGVMGIPFKGPVLAAFYGDISLRQFGDIDVLIDEKNVQKAIKVLEELDYFPGKHLSDAQISKLCKTDNEFPLYNRKTGITLDLQWELSGGYFSSKIMLSDIKNNLNKIKLIKSEVSTFLDESLLLYLCIHGNQHVWQLLDHVCCVNEVLRNIPCLRWDLVLSNARHLGAFRMLSVGVILANRLFNTAVPEEVLTLLRKDNNTLKLVEDRCQYLFFSSSLSASKKINISHRFSKYHLKSLDSNYGALKYSVHLFFVPTRYDWEVYPLPSRLSFIHYIIRPIRMIREWIKRRFSNDISKNRLPQKCKFQ